MAINGKAVEFDKVIDLATATDLSVYDASYLWLARSLGAELVTLDRKLARVAAAP
jgi:predicted nucleic acid-binding protein